MYLFIYLFAEFCENLPEDSRENIIMNHVLPCVKVNCHSVLLVYGVVSDESCGQEVAAQRGGAVQRFLCLASRGGVTLHLRMYTFATLPFFFLRSRSCDCSEVS